MGIRFVLFIFLIYLQYMRTYAQDGASDAAHGKATGWKPIVPHRHQEVHERLLQLKTTHRAYWGSALRRDEMDLNKYWATVAATLSDPDPQMREIAARLACHDHGCLRVFLAKFLADWEDELARGPIRRDEDRQRLRYMIVENLVRYPDPRHIDALLRVLEHDECIGYHTGGPGSRDLFRMHPNIFSLAAEGLHRITEGKIGQTEKIPNTEQARKSAAEWRKWWEANKEAILRAHRDATELVQAVQDRDIGKLRELIDKGADVNAKDMEGMTALHWASEKGVAEIVELLVRKGAHINAKDRKDKTPFDHASKEAIQQLLDKHGGKSAKELK